jgi:hypothetical protein
VAGMAIVGSATNLCRFQLREAEKRLGRFLERKTGRHRARQRVEPEVRDEDTSSFAPCQVELEASQP